jgi:outer membrane phospholipase A
MDYLSVSVDSTSLTEGIYEVSVELQNDIEWTPYETVNNALNVTNAATSMYPSSFTLKKRILSGSIGQYVLSNFNSDTQQWKTGVPIVIKAGETDEIGFQFNLTGCTFTNRNKVADVFTQAYDWKMNDNPADLGNIIKFNNI